MEATHDAKTMEEGHDLDVAPGRSNAELARLLPHPAADANKYTRGHLNLVAGSAAYPGAACLAAAAGERAGAGYTEVFCAGKSMITVRGWRRLWWCATGERGSRPRRPRPGRVTRPPASSAAASTRRRRPSPRFLWKRCGAGRRLCSSTGAPSRFSPTPPDCAWPASGPQPGARRYSRPTAAKRRAWPEAPGRPWKRLRLRPPRNARPPGRGRGHPIRRGRATLAEAAPAPAALARALAEAYGAVVALKGPVTFIASPDGTAEVMDRGTSALAKAGTGDVLAGMIGALLAQGLDPRDAAALGCALHAEAGRPPRQPSPTSAPAPRISSPSFPRPSAPSPPRRFGGPYARPARTGFPGPTAPPAQLAPAPFARRAAPPLLTRVNSESHRICGFKALYWDVIESRKGRSCTPSKSTAARSWPLAWSSLPSSPPSPSR